MSDGLVVATFNVHHGVSTDGRVDVGLLARSCAALGADVVALQEVDRGTRRSGGADLAAEVAGACGMSFSFGPVRRRGWRGRYGNALLARGGFRHVQTLRLPRSGWRERRGAIVAVVTTQHGPLSVACAHLGQDRAESAAQLAVLVDVLVQQPLPRLLLGDLNRRPRSTC